MPRRFPPSLVCWVLALAFCLLACSDDDGPSQPERPDLTVQSIAYVPESPGPEVVVTARVTVRNSGNATSPPTRLRVDLDGSAKFSAQIGALPPGQTVTPEGLLGSLPAGTYQVEACADADGECLESDEGNNCRTQVLTVGQGPPPPNGPDLEVVALVFEPPQPGPLDDVQVTVTVRNSGDRPADPCHLRVAVDEIAVCGSLAVGTLEVGAQSEHLCHLGLLAPGQRSIRACVDIQGEVVELDESDNCASIDFTVSGPTGGPDLIIRGLVVEPGNPGPNDPIAIEFTVHNAGDMPASTNNVVIRVDGMIRLGFQVGPIPFGQSVRIGGVLGLLAVGPHEIEICADVYGEVRETNEANNCLTMEITVAGPADLPDLRIRALLLDLSFPSPEDSVTASVVVANEGEGPAGASMTRVRLDEADLCPAIPTGELAVGEADTVSCFLGSLSPGRHVVDLCVDAVAEVSESDEGNNCATYEFDVSAGRERGASRLLERASETRPRRALGGAVF